MFEQLQSIINRVAAKKNLRGELLSAQLLQKYLTLAADFFPQKNIRTLVRMKYFRAGIIFAATAHPVVSQELRLHENAILDELKKIFPEIKIKSVRLVIENLD